jgi:hypothetical protein
MFFDENLKFFDRFLPAAVIIFRLGCDQKFKNLAHF